ncbi:MAG TPA: AAA family ATPase, partial [Virgibacillus sp.]|nr:AAA family ATPase [Virgibacillus sp.]
MERLNNQSAVYKKMLQNSNIPREDLSQMAKNNVYQAILYGVPFYLVDEYASVSKKFKYNDPRRLTGALCAAYLDKIAQGHTYLHNIKDSTKSVQGKTIITRGNSLHASMTKILSNSSKLFNDQYKLIDWFEKTDGKVVPRVNAHLFYSSLTRMNDIKLFNRKIFEYSEYNGKTLLRHLPSFWSEYQICDRIISLLLEENFLKSSKNVIETKAAELGADEKQALAISEVFNNKVSIVTGYAGTGKSKMIEILSELLLEENTDLDIKICAPTGIAAQNLQKRLLANKSAQIKQYFS